MSAGVSVGIGEHKGEKKVMDNLKFQMNEAWMKF